LLHAPYCAAALPSAVAYAIQPACARRLFHEIDAAVRLSARCRQQGDGESALWCRFRQTSRPLKRHYTAAPLALLVREVMPRFAAAARGACEMRKKMRVEKVKEKRGSRRSSR